MTDKIITISREYGSGGRTVGELVAKELGIPFYDKAVVNAVAEKSGFSPEFIEESGEYASVSNSFLFSIAVSSQLNGSANFTSSADQLYQFQTKYIRQLAEEGPCVIVGRCADYILREKENAVHAFIYADMPYRVQYMAEHHGKNPAHAEKWLKERDNRRRVYYRHYTGRNWGDPHNYDLSLSTSALGAEKAAEFIINLAK